jgi:hypothetical protein
MIEVEFLVGAFGLELDGVGLDDVVAGAARLAGAEPRPRAYGMLSR